MFRKVLVGLSRHGRKVFEGFAQKGEGAAKHGQKKAEVSRTDGVHHAQSQLPIRTVASLTKIQNAVTPRSYLIQQLTRYARKNLASELRRQFNKSPIYRDYSGLANKLSMLAFVGVGFASQGNTEEERFNSICDQIKGIFENKTPSGDNEKDFAEHGLEDYHIGPMIAKGCSAAVYQARSKTNDECISMELDSGDEESDGCDTSDVRSDTSEVECMSETESDIEVIEEEDELSSSFVFPDQEVEDMVTSVNISWKSETDSEISVLEDGQEADGEDASVMFLFSCQQDSDTKTNTDPTEGDFDLAIKMMFNYDVESNASALYREMQKELLPSRTQISQNLLGFWENGHRAKDKTRLPPHPNIVDMVGAFVDEVPELPEGMDKYPEALPQRINQDGCGRNKTLFLVMKRYPLTLRDYLARHPALSTDTSLLLLTQLVEAVAHLVDHGVSHRDLKSDNIFVDDSDPQCPHLVVSDFGESSKLCVPYFSDDVGRGGNMALMAPEIRTAVAGPQTHLDYSKADLWAVGTLAYEIFGSPNPFYHSNKRKKLSSATYRESDLPSLPDHVPEGIKHLIELLLQREPNKRPSPSQAATVLQMVLLAPTEWDLTSTSTLSRSNSRPGRKDVIRWLLILTAHVLCEKAMGLTGTRVDLKRLFLGHLDFHEVLTGVDVLWTGSM